MDILDDLLNCIACEFCGSHIIPIRICADCGRFYCQECAARGEGHTIEEQCRMCDLYADWSVSNHGRYWIFTGRINKTTVDVHTAHKHFVAVTERARLLAETLSERVTAEPSELEDGAEASG